MIESIGGIVSLLNEFKNGLQDSWDIIQKGKKKKVFRKLIKLKLIIEDIVETADEIFDLIDEIKRQKRTPKEKIEKLKELIRVQESNLSDFLRIFHDPILDKILKTFNSDLSRRIVILINSKKIRIDFFMLDLYNLKANDIRKRYNQQYLDDGKNLIDNLRKSSNSYSSFLKEHISLEEFIYNYL